MLAGALNLYPFKDFGMSRSVGLNQVPPEAGDEALQIAPPGQVYMNIRVNEHHSLHENNIVHENN